ncbi:MAG: hydroxymyristoyl-ACP dehydratase [Dysgonamonadaceae bacterium]|jgi:predicted hotdog family 3-hydroxylacyl-ACP dehydratase|nr:hydroxymyristoyl-ACP dehydratase [Dysgonamonadaceae bacterium]
MISGKNNTIFEQKARQVLAAGEAVKAFIPQREPLVMVDAFYGIEGSRSYSGLTVEKDNLFVENGLLNESGIIEHIAQSCSLRVGYLCKQQNIPVPVGYIGAVRKMKIYDLPQVGQQLYTTINMLSEVFDISLVSAEVTVNDILIAVCEMKISLANQS